MLAGLGRLGQDISPAAMDESTYGAGLINTLVEPPPPPPPGWQTGQVDPSNIAPPSVVSPSIPKPGPVTIGPGTLLTYTVNYNLQGASNFFTSNSDAMGTAAQMLGAVGLQVVNTATPASINPFSSNSAILTLQVTGAGFQSAAAVKALCDNAFAVGVGAQIISSTIAVGAGNSALNWLSQNWQLLAVGGLALLILPKILDDFV